MVLFDSKEATIKGLDCTDTHMLIWTNKKIEIHEIVAGLSNKYYIIICIFIVFFPDLFEPIYYLAYYIELKNKFSVFLVYYIYIFIYIYILL